jgi:Protein of unknown function (DUF3237)
VMSSASVNCIVRNTIVRWTRSKEIPVTTLLAEARVDFQPDHHRIGPTPDEIIFHYNIASGTIRGPRIELVAIANGGGEWDTVRGDGVIAFESRQLLRNPSGELVYVSFNGFYDVGEDGYENALDDLLTSTVPAEFVVRFHAAGEYRWLNRVLLFGRGQRDFSSHTLTVDIFALEPGSNSARSAQGARFQR